MPSHDDDAPVPTRRRKKKYHSGQKKGNSAPVSSSPLGSGPTPLSFPFSPPLFALRIPVAILSSLRLRLRGRERGERKEEEKGKIRFRLSISHAHLLRKRNSPTFTKRAEKIFFHSSVGIDIHELLFSYQFGGSHTLGSQRVGGGSLLVCSGGGQGKKKKKAFPLFLSFSPSAFILSSLTPFERTKKRPHFPFSVWRKKKIEGTFLDTKKLLKTSTPNVIWQKSSYCAAVYFPLEFLRLILGDQREGIPPPPRKWEGRIWSQHHHPTTDTFKTTFLRRTKSRLSNSRFEPKERRIGQLYHC